MIAAIQRIMMQLFHQLHC